MYQLQEKVRTSLLAHSLADAKQTAALAASETPDALLGKMAEFGDKGSQIDAIIRVAAKREIKMRCQHLDYRDTLDGSTCNTCGLEWSQEEIDQETK